MSLSTTATVDQHSSVRPWNNCATWWPQEGLTVCMSTALIVWHAITRIRCCYWKSFCGQVSRSIFSIGKWDKHLKISCSCPRDTQRDISKQVEKRRVYSFDLSSK